MEETFEYVRVAQERIGPNVAKVIGFEDGGMIEIAVPNDADDLDSGIDRVEEAMKNVQVVGGYDDLRPPGALVASFRPSRRACGG